MILKKVLLYIPAILLLLPLLFLKKDLELFPSENKYKLVTYSDNTDSTGNTLADIQYSNDTSILFKYTLIANDSFPDRDPFAGFAIELCKKAPFIDISEFDYLSVDIITKHAGSFIVNIKTYIDGFTDINDWHTYHIETVQVPVHFGSITYKIPLSDFRIPEWWWKEVGPVALNLPRNADRKKLFGIDFQNGSGSVKNKDDQFIIKKIRFVKNRTMLSTVLIVSSLVYIFLISLLSVFVKRRKNTHTDKGLQYTRLEIGNTANEESERIRLFIGKNFQNPDLTLDDVARDVGISSTRISAVLQKANNVSFKQYLNEIRIAEAKRLLKDTDRSITEIGFSVGYNNITHFNRVFKVATDLSPSEFREKQV